MAHKYFQYHFDGEGKHKSIENEEKEERKGEKKEKGRREIHPSGLEFSKVRWNAGNAFFQGA